MDSVTNNDAVTDGEAPAAAPEAAAVVERNEEPTVSHLDEELRKYETKLREVEAMEDKEAAKGELRQLGRALEELQLPDAESGKRSAKYYRKAVLARLDALRSHVDETYSELDKENDRLHNVREARKDKVREYDELAARLADERRKRRKLEDEHARQLEEKQAEIDDLTYEERALLRDHRGPCTSYRVVTTTFPIAPFVPFLAF